MSRDPLSILLSVTSLHNNQDPWWGRQTGSRCFPGWFTARRPTSAQTQGSRESPGTLAPHHLTPGTRGTQEPAHTTNKPWQLSEPGSRGPHGLPCPFLSHGPLPELISPGEGLVQTDRSYPREPGSAETALALSLTVTPRPSHPLCPRFPQHTRDAPTQLCPFPGHMPVPNHHSGPGRWAWPSPGLARGGTRQRI